MKKYKFNKLVRDKIVEHQLNSGAKPNFKKLSKNEYKLELINKLTEEADEIKNASKEEVAGEIADARQILDDLAKAYNLRAKDIDIAKKDKLTKNGGFSKRFYINYVEVDQKSKWGKYYEDNKDRYPEV